ncbi:MAG: hypothetical protein M3010_08110 [Candidatus Dormibacteraeota bacterium]|nr:hypothetical protein [Candidatus Dormibacteraeota bacterium]
MVQLSGRRSGSLDSSVEPSAIALLPDDHPVLLLLDEVDCLRTQLEDREVEIASLRGDLSQAYDRECDLVRILHRYVVAEQAAQERRRWWAPVGRGSR